MSDLPSGYDDLLESPVIGQLATVRPFPDSKQYEQ
jgi:hypothetical protein